MPIRKAVEDLVRAGVLPAEDEAVEAEIEERQRLIELIDPPISDDEAQALLMVLGVDDCFGLAWSLIHMIETALSALIADYSQNADNEWVSLLEERRQIQN